MRAMQDQMLDHVKRSIGSVDRFSINAKLRVRLPGGDRAHRESLARDSESRVPLPTSVKAKARVIIQATRFYPVKEFLTHRERAGRRVLHC